MADRSKSRGTGTASRASLSGSAAAERAKAHLTEMTGRECESVSCLSRTADGWLVKLEIVELERIPQSTDILATYQVQLDSEGELIGYERVARYYRNQASSEEG